MEGRRRSYGVRRAWVFAAAHDHNFLMSEDLDVVASCTLHCLHSKMCNSTPANFLRSSGELAWETKTFNWVLDPAREGEYVKMVNGSLVVEDIVSQRSRILIPAAQVPKDVHGFWFNTNVTKILWAVDAVKQYRYSFFADYLVQDVESKVIEPLVKGQQADVQYATWNPNAK